MDTRALFNIGYGLYILSVNDGVKDNACIINTVMQVTSDPVQIAICVNKMNYTNEIIKKTKKFNISILTKDSDFSVFKNFGYQSGKTIDKFSLFNDTKRSPNGLLYITKNTNSYISAYVQKEIEFETHTMFIAQLTYAECLSDCETVTYNYYQNNIKPKPNEVKKHGFRCKICGYFYEGEELPNDFICPLCKHGAIDFEKV